LPGPLYRVPPPRSGPAVPRDGRRYLERGRPKRTSARIAEAEVRGGPPARSPPALVHQPVVGAAQRHEVVERRLSAVSPVAKMVAVERALSSTPGEPAPSAVTVTHDPAKRSAGRTASPADLHRSSVTLEHPLDPGVARDAAHRLRRQPAAQLGLGQPGAGGRLLAGQRRCVGVDDEDRATGAVYFPGGHSSRRASAIRAPAGSSGESARTIRSARARRAASSVRASSAGRTPSR
jgi:hypothetical protein